MLNRAKLQNKVKASHHKANINKVNIHKRTHKKTLPIMILSIFILGLFVQACSKKSNTPNEPIEQKYFINGDPIVFAQKTANNSKSFFTPENIQSFDGYNLVRIGTFTEKTTSKDAEVKDMEDAKEKQKTTSKIKKSNEPDIYTYQMTKRSNKASSEVSDEYVFESASDHPNTLKLVLRPSSVHPGTLDLQALELKSAHQIDQQKVQTIHYSISPDKSRFSVLVYMKLGAQNGNTIMALYFTKLLAKPVEIKSVGENNIYLFGPGAPIGWNQEKPVELTLCGLDSSRFYSDIKGGVSLWQEPLTQRLEIQTKTSYGDECPPFSDVNIHGLYFIDQHKLVDGDAVICPAAALAIPDLSRGEITDADIFVFKAEYMKSINHKNPSLVWEDHQVEKMLSSLRSIVAHEFGHFLGLGHKFDGTYSIMAYGDEFTNYLTRYDTKAIQELYSLKTKPQENTTNSTPNTAQNSNPKNAQDNNPQNK